MVQVLKDPMGTKGARVTTEVTLPGRFLVLMPFSEFVGVSRKLPDEERDRLHASIARGTCPRAWASSSAPSRRACRRRTSISDLEFLLRLWRRVEHQAHEGLAPEVIYTEMDLALRMVRDVFSEDFRRLLVDDKSLYEKVVSFLKKTSPTLVRRVELYRERPAAVRRVSHCNRRSTPR